MEGLPAGWVSQHITVTATAGLQGDRSNHQHCFYSLSFLNISRSVKSHPYYPFVWGSLKTRGSLSSWPTHSDPIVTALPPNEMLQHKKMLVNFYVKFSIVSKGSVHSKSRACSPSEQRHQTCLNKASVFKTHERYWFFPGRRLAARGSRGASSRTQALEPIPAVTGWRPGHTLDKRLGQGHNERQTHTHTRGCIRVGPCKLEIRLTFNKGSRKVANVLGKNLPTLHQHYPWNSAKPNYRNTNGNGNT